MNRVRERQYHSAKRSLSFRLKFTIAIPGNRHRMVYHSSVWRIQGDGFHLPTKQKHGKDRKKQLNRCCKLGRKTRGQNQSINSSRFQSRGVQVRNVADKYLSAVGSCPVVSFEIRRIFHSPPPSYCCGCPVASTKHRGRCGPSANKTRERFFTRTE